MVSVHSEQKPVCPGVRKIYRLFPVCAASNTGMFPSSLMLSGPTLDCVLKTTTITKKPQALLSRAHHSGTQCSPSLSQVLGSISSMPFLIPPKTRREKVCAAPAWDGAMVECPHVSTFFSFILVLRVLFSLNSGHIHFDIYYKTTAYLLEPH